MPVTIKHQLLTCRCLVVSRGFFSSHMLLIVSCYSLKNMDSSFDSLNKQLKAEVLIKPVIALVAIDIRRRNSEHTQTKQSWQRHTCS